MKSRVFIRALCVGTALLVPASGLTTLGVTTTGATTNQQLTVTGIARMGGLGVAIIGPILCTMVATQCAITQQITITKNGTQALKALPATWKILVKQTNTNLVITAVGLKRGAFGLKATGFTHCKISTVPAASLSLTAGKWVATTISLSGVTISTTGGTCTKKTTLTTDFTHKLSYSFSRLLTRDKT
jgi:hypothetical protein